MRPCEHDHERLGARRRAGGPPRAHRRAGDRGPLLEVEDLKTYFQLDAGNVRAVDGVSFTLDRGKTLGVVGESGSGKTVLSRSIMGIIIARNVLREGSVMYDGRQLVGDPPPSSGACGAGRWRWCSRTR